MTATATPQRVRSTVSTRPLLAVFLAMHGVAHYAGTSGAVGALDDGTTAAYLGGAWHVGGSAALTLLAFLWAIVGTAYLGVAVLVWRRDDDARGALLGVTAASLLLSLVAVWAAIVGVVIDAVLLAVAWHTPERLELER